MNYIRAFTGTLPSLGSYVALDFTQIESVVSGEHFVADPEAIEKKALGTLVRLRSGAVMLFQVDEEKVFLVVWNQFVLESQQQERVESWSKR